MATRQFYARNAKTVMRAEQDFLKQYPDCTIFKTNYTVKMVAGEYAELWTARQINRGVFAGFKKLESAITKSGLELPEVDRDNITYWRFNEQMNYPSSFYIVDLNSAYLQALKNLGFIDEHTFDYCNSLPKIARLQCVGMLATQKVVHEVRGGSQFSLEVKKNDNRSLFFAACQVVGELLNEIYIELGGSSAFWYWVDGIAVSPEKANEVIDFFNERGFPSKLEKVENCTVQGRRIRYYKDGRKIVLILPQRKPITNKSVLNFLNNAE